MNSKRMFSGADMKFFGIQLNKIEPSNVILFTALGPSFFGNNELGSFLDLKADSHNFFKEVFRFDQKLNVINFRDVNPNL